MLNSRRNDTVEYILYEKEEIFSFIYSVNTYPLECMKTAHLKADLTVLIACMLCKSPGDHEVHLQYSIALSGAQVAPEKLTIFRSFATSRLGEPISPCTNSF